MAQSGTMIIKHYSTVSVIGSAGRKGDGEKMTHQLFTNAVEKTIQVITEEMRMNLSNVRLVSGGAAWSDHIAVQLFLQKVVPALTLHLPAEWVSKPKPCFHDNGKNRFNPGRMSNEFHKQFSQKIGRDTLSEIQQAKDSGAIVKTYSGFHQRNKHVAESGKLIAFTWNDGAEPPPSGGTRHTWDHCSKGLRVHVPYSTLLNATSTADPAASSNSQHSIGTLAKKGIRQYLTLSSGCEKTEQTGSSKRKVPKAREKRKAEIQCCSKKFNKTRKLSSVRSKAKHTAAHARLVTTQNCSDDIEHDEILKEFDGFDIFCDDDDDIIKLLINRD